MDRSDPEGCADRTIELARAYLKGGISPLQVSRDIAGFGLAHLPCWEASGGASGPLAALYEASEDEDELHFLGDAIELWHADVRERKRVAVARAEEKWRPSVTEACEALIRCGERR